MPRSEAVGLVKETNRRIIDAQYITGFVGFWTDPAAFNEDLRNVPDSINLNGRPCRTPNPTFPEQWFYKKQEWQL